MYVGKYNNLLLGLLVCYCHSWRNSGSIFAMYLLPYSKKQPYLLS